jgi:hypothetical protein
MRSTGTEPAFACGTNLQQIPGGQQIFMRTDRQSVGFPEYAGILVQAFNGYRGAVCSGTMRAGTMRATHPACT